MTSYASYLIAFCADASTLIVLSYVLARGKTLRMLFRERLSAQATALLGICLGLIGLMESHVPEAGFHYASSTLCIAFATSIGGLPVGLLTSAVILGGAAFNMPHNAIGLLPTIIVSALMAKSIRRARTIPVRLFYGFFLGALAQACRLLVRNMVAHLWILPPMPAPRLLSIPANGVGLLLLLLVVSEAQVRADSEQNRIEKEQKQLEAERAHALTTEARLAALSSRVHPHFLFNALNSIAELCCISPERAETACLNLSNLMRWTLNTGAAGVVSLGDELSLTRAYLQIEQERLGERLCVRWNTRSACEEETVVPFAIQILVENAINHGLANKIDVGTVSITVRCSPRRTVVAVSDDGIGMTRDPHVLVPHSITAAKHGLQILNQQLILRYGASARLRLYSRESRGTLVIFGLPRTKSLKMEATKSNDDRTHRR
jgi:hypothetical protein